MHPQFDLCARVDSRPRLGLAVACLLALAGCVTDQGPDARMQLAASTPTADMARCAGDTVAKPKYDALKGKLYLGSEAAYPAGFLANPRHPDKAEVALLTALQGDFQQCRTLNPPAVPAAQPLIFRAFVEKREASDKLWAEAIAGRLTWGRLNDGLRSAALGRVRDITQTTARTGPDSWSYLGPQKPPENLGPDPLGERERYGRRGPSMTIGDPTPPVYCSNMAHTTYCSQR